MNNPNMTQLERAATRRGKMPALTVPDGSRLVALTRHSSQFIQVGDEILLRVEEIFVNPEDHTRNKATLRMWSKAGEQEISSVKGSPVYFINEGVTFRTEWIGDFNGRPQVKILIVAPAETTVLRGELIRKEEKKNAN